MEQIARCFRCVGNQPGKLAQTGPEPPPQVPRDPQHTGVTWGAFPSGPTCKDSDSAHLQQVGHPQGLWQPQGPCQASCAKAASWFLGFLAAQLCCALSQATLCLTLCGLPRRLATSDAPSSSGAGRFWL